MQFPHEVVKSFSCCLVESDEAKIAKHRSKLLLFSINFQQKRWQWKFSLHSWHHCHSASVSFLVSLRKIYNNLHQFSFHYNIVANRLLAFHFQLSFPCRWEKRNREREGTKNSSNLATTEKGKFKLGTEKKKLFLVQLSFLFFHLKTGAKVSSMIYFIMCCKRPLLPIKVLITLTLSSPSQVDHGGVIKYSWRKPDRRTSFFHSVIQLNHKPKHSQCKYHNDEFMCVLISIVTYESWVARRGI